jgi:hypothetical protein
MLEASSRPHHSFVWEIANLKFWVRHVCSIESVVHVGFEPLQRSFLDNRRFESQGQSTRGYDAIRCIVAHGRSCWCTVFQGGERLAMLLF